MQTVKFKIQIYLKIFILIGCFATPSLKAQFSSSTELLYRLRMQNIDTLFSAYYNPIVKPYIEKNTTTNKLKTEKAISVFNFYNSLIENELSKRNLPSSLQYLPLALTQMDIRYQGEYHRSGAWALSIFIAQKYGLSVTNEIDERFDFYKSTSAACDYLQELYQLYGNFWDVVIAYANGASALQATKIRLQAKHTNIWDIYENSNLFNKNVIPLMFSFAYIANYYQEHELKLKEYQVINSETIYLKAAIYVTDLYTQLELSENDFYAVNPILLKCDCLKECNIHLPLKSYDLFANKEDTLYEMYKATQLYLDSIAKAEVELVKKESEITYYTVKKGDNLGYIARRYHVTVSDLKKWNQLKNDNIYIGERLIIRKN